MLLSKIVHPVNKAIFRATLSGSTLFICMKVILIGIFLLFFQAARSQNKWVVLDQELEAKKKLLGDNLVMMIVKGDSVIYQKTTGDFNAKTQAPIASCSKWLTAALVIQFVGEGRLSLDDKVGKYIPEFDKYFKSYVTIRQCLSHMTGISDDDKFLKRLLERRKFASLEEEVNEFAKRDIRAKPGTDFWYGNVGLNIAGRVLEVIGKKKFDILIKTKLLNPLGMTKTTFTDLNGFAVNPSGGARSTAEDYMKFLVMLLNGGIYDGKRIIDQEALEELFMVQNTVDQVRYAPKAATGYTYAFGAWAMETEPFTSDGKRIASVLACPGLFGTWPLIDFRREYAYIVFVKNLLGEERAETHKELKKVVDSILDKR
jgi:CubicO group peptidase (beta-lactamase class C family)